MSAELSPGDAAAFARLAREFAAEPDVEQTVQRVIESAQASIPGCDYAGFTLTHPDHLESAAATSPLVADLDRAQHELSEGPCLDAARDAEIYLIRDTTTDQRWPRWCARAAQAGVLSVLSVRLIGPQPLLASMNLYATTRDAYDEDAVTTAQIYASHAGTAISAATESEQLHFAMDGRHAIGVAQGLLMQRYGISESSAFALLSRHSQAQNVKLRLVALDIAHQAAAGGGRLP